MALSIFGRPLRVGQKSLHTLIHIVRAHMSFAMLRLSSNVAAVALVLVLGVADTLARQRARCTDRNIGLR